MSPATATTSVSTSPRVSHRARRASTARATHPKRFSPTPMPTRFSSSSPRTTPRRASRVTASASASSCKLTTSVIAPTVDRAVVDIADAVEKGADIVELRVDFLKAATRAGRAEVKTSIEALLKACPVPAIVTYRPTWEGGQHDGEEDERLAGLWAAVELGAAYVDCEALAAERFFAAKPEGLSVDKSKTRIILSSHNYDETPSAEELRRIHEKCVASGADIVKMASVCNDIEDVGRLEALLREKTKEIDTIVLGMSEHGQVSRLLAAKFGSFLTFGAIRRGEESAPGQPLLEELRDLYRVPTQTAATKVMGVIGNPIGHSKSPALHNPCLAAANVDACYVPLLVKDIKSFLASPLFGSSDFVGFSVTIPHKEDALEACAEVDPVAKQIGAVNTLVRQPDGSLKGYNTDYVAAIEAIENAMERKTGVSAATSLQGKTVVVVGAGGAGKALAFGAKFKGADVIIVNRSVDRAQALAEACGGKAASLEDLAAGRVVGDVLANSTSVGMQPNVDDTPAPASVLGAFSVVFDAVYTPLETRLLREAKAAGCEQASGLDMFVGQAARQFELFTGERAETALMRDAVLSSMKA